MKITLLPVVAAAALACTSIPRASADEVVSTGLIQSVSDKREQLTLHSEQSHSDLLVYGLDKANIFTADGKALTTADLQPGQRVTLEYAMRGQRWYVSKVILSEPRPAARVGAEATERIRESTEGDARTPSAPAGITPQEAPFPSQRKLPQGAVHRMGS